MEDHLAVGRDVIGDSGRDADAEIDEPAFGNVARDACGDALAVERRDVRCLPCGRIPWLQPGTCSTRCTKTPGVCTCSGVECRRGPTMWCVSTMVSVAAIAITGLKFCCALAIGQVAPAVGLPRFDQRDVAGQRIFQQAELRPLITRVSRPSASSVSAPVGRVEGLDAGAGGAHAFRERALRHDLQLQLAALELAARRGWRGARSCTPSCARGRAPAGARSCCRRARRRRRRW